MWMIINAGSCPLTKNFIIQPQNVLQSYYVTSLLSSVLWLIDFEVWCFKATFNNVSVIPWRPVSVFSETTKQIWSKLAINVHWMVLYQICVFGADRKLNMAARANDVFWLVWHFENLLVRNHQTNWIVPFQERSLGGSVLNLWIVCRLEIQDGHHNST